ncbi:MAG: NUDIX domain-containing protein [Candidatus Dojkabacteria bacterium]
MKEIYKVKLVSLVVLEKNNQILLIRRLNTGWEDGKYTVPSGHLEEGEKPLEAAVRETREEVGVELNTDDLKLVHVDFFDNYIHLYFKCSKWSGEPQIMEPNKCDDILWASYNDLPENLAGHGHETLRAIGENILFSEYD